PPVSIELYTLSLHDALPILGVSLKNIARHGDTDVFPFPLEKLVFHDRYEDCKALLAEIHAKFDEYIARFPPNTLETLTQVGYTGDRKSTRLNSSHVKISYAV